MNTSTGESTLDWIDTRAAARAKAGLVRQLQPRSDRSTDLDLTGNDYLGFARDNRVMGAAAAATLRWGAGSTGSRLITGSTELHAELEYELARFCGVQAALVFSSGYLANLGALTALTGAGTAIVADWHIHASLIDATRLSKADVAVVDHRDLTAFRNALATRRRDRAMVVTDSVFSVDGDLAPLEQLLELSRNGNSGLLVDDAHGFGVLGNQGNGAVPAAGIAGAPDVVTTITLSKALGAQGGAVLGPRRVIKHIVDTARSFIFDTGLAPGNVAAALAALTALRAEPDRPARARDTARVLADRLRENGLPVSQPDAAVLAIRAASADAAVTWARQCGERGVLVGCFRPPSVPDRISRLRLTARADLTEADLDRAVSVITECRPDQE